MEQKNQKMFFAFSIYVFELGAANSQNSDKDTCYRQSVY